MARFHINNAGNAGLCRATKGGCPFGGDDAHYPSKESAREAFEARMEGAPSIASRMKQPHKEMFISVLTSSHDVLTERTGDQLGNLEPGDYIAQYYDQTTDEDKYIRVQVRDDSSVGYEDIPGFLSLTPNTSEKTLAAFKEADNAYRDLNADPVHCAKNKIDRVTLLESSKGFERILAKYDITKAQDATLAREELENLEWALDHDLELAERDGKSEELNALKSAKAPLAKLLDTFRS